MVFASNTGGLQFDGNNVTAGVTLKSSAPPVSFDGNTAIGNLASAPSGDTAPTGRGNNFKSIAGCPNVS